MLAQNFKTHTDLGLDEALYNALKKVLVRLETNDLVWVGDLDVEFEMEGVGGFNMVIDMLDCGTVGCIGGWAAYEMGVDLSLVMNNKNLSDLFFPSFGAEYYRICYEIKPEQAAIALRNYLTTGEISWAHLK